VTRSPIAGTTLFCFAWLAGCAGTPPAGSSDLDPGSPRIVVMAPAAAEMLQALGLIDHVVGIGEFGPWPAAIAGRPQAGGYASPNVEQVLALRADMLVTTASEAAVAGHRRLEAVGVEVLALDTSTYEGIFGALSDLGAAFGRQDDARRIESRMREEIRALESRAAELPRRRVLFVVGRDPLYVAGPGSHVDRMIAGVGGRNVLEPLELPARRAAGPRPLDRSVATGHPRPAAPRDDATDGPADPPRDVRRGAARALRPRGVLDTRRGGRRCRAVGR